MQRAEKVALSLPKGLFREVEKLRRATGETRSGLVARALQLLLAERSRRERVREYVEGYREHPESDREVASAEAAAKQLLSEVPWE